MPPKVVLKELKDSLKSKKIYEKILNPSQNVSVEDVIAEKRSQ